MRIFNPATQQYADVTPEAFQQVWSIVGGWLPAEPVDDEAEEKTAVVTADNDGPVRAKAKDK